MIRFDFFIFSLYISQQVANFFKGGEVCIELYNDLELAYYRITC